MTVSKRFSDAEIWRDIAKIFVMVSKGKAPTRETNGICHQIFMKRFAGQILSRQRDRMLDQLHRHVPTKKHTENLFFFPLTRKGAEQRTRLCRKIARECQEAKS